MALTPEQIAAQNQASIDAANAANKKAGITEGAAPGSAFVNPAPYTPAEVTAAAAKTSSAGTSPFSSSAMVGGAGNTQSATDAAAAKLSGQTPPTPPSVAVTQGTPGTPGFQTISITPNKQYQYQLPNGQMMSVTDPTINTAALAGAKFIMGPTGAEADPLLTTPNSTQNNQGGALPSGYTASTPDPTSGNITYSNSKTGTTFTLASGVDPSKVATGYNNVQTNVQANLGAGYQTQVQPDGSFNVTDAQGNVIGNIPVAAASDPTTALPAYVTAMTTKSSATTAANTVMQGELATLDASHKATLDQLNRQMDAAIGEAGAGTGGFGKSGESGAQQRVQTLIDEENSSYQANQATIKGQNQQAIAAANADYEKNTTSVLQTAQAFSLSEAQFANTKQQQAMTNAQNLVTKIDTPTAQLQGLKLDANGSTGVGSVDAAVNQFVQAGMTPGQALSLVQQGSIAQNKANLAQWTTNLKNVDLTNLTPDMTLDQAMKDPGLNYLITSGANVAGSNDAAFALLQRGSTQQLTQLKLQAQTLEVQAQTAKANIEAALAPERVATMQMSQAINEAVKLNTDNFKAGTWGGTLLAIANYLPNIESAMKSGGKGVSALTAIDALVKIDTGGQAVRQGQTNLLTESGTWGDSAATFMAKLGLSTSEGANTVLSAAQMQQVYTLAKQTAAEKINTVSGAYSSYKNGINTLKSAYPQSQAEIDAASANIAQIDQFMQTYGTELGTPGGNTPDTATSILSKYGIQ